MDSIEFQETKKRVRQKLESEQREERIIRAVEKAAFRNSEQMSRYEKGKMFAEAIIANGLKQYNSELTQVKRQIPDLAATTEQNQKDIIETKAQIASIVAKAQVLMSMIESSTKEVEARVDALPIPTVDEIEASLIRYGWNREGKQGEPGETGS